VKSLMLLTPLLMSGAATGLSTVNSPAPGTAEAAVLVPVWQLLKAVEDHDAKSAFDAVRADGRTTQITENADGSIKVDHRTWKEVIDENFKPTPDRWKEKMGPLKIEVEGPNAVVWVSYQLIINNEIQQCGYGSYALVREAGRWKILNMVVTDQHQGCVKIS